MKTLPGKRIFPVLMLVSLVTCFAEEVEPRKIIKMPSGITHHRAGGKSTYVISGIIRHTPELKLNEANRAHQLLIPDCSGFRLDRSGRKCSFVTTEELPLSELADTIDLLAKKGGEVPYWAELEARDLPVSEKGDVSYKITSSTKKIADDLHWVSLQKDESFETAITLSSEGTGRILIVPSTAMCMCHSRYSIRILDAEQKVIWRDDREAYGSIRVAIADIDGDKSQEILLSRSDHGKDGNFVIRLEGK